MPQKAGCAGSNKVSDCCNNLETRKEMLGHPVKVNVLETCAKKCKTCNLGHIIVSML